MNQKNKPPTQSQDTIGDLLRMAGGPSEIAAQRRDRVHDAVYAQWQAHHRARRGRAIRGLAALAAAVVLAGFLFVVARPDRTPFPNPGPTAQVERFAGQVTWSMEGEDKARPLQSGTEIPSGSAISSAATGRASLRLATGASLRLDHNTRLLLRSPTQLRVVSGTVYVDAARENQAVRIQTDLADVRDIGTQFEVMVGEDAIRVRVREGGVLINNDALQTRAVAGEEVVLHASDKLEKRSIPRVGPLWQWVMAIAPVPRLNDLSVDGFLHWYSRESGRKIRYLDSDLDRELGGVVVLGPTDQFSIHDALETVMATSGLRYTQTEDELQIASLEGDQP